MTLGEEEAFPCLPYLFSISVSFSHIVEIVHFLNMHEMFVPGLWETKNHGWKSIQNWG